MSDELLDVLGRIAADDAPPPLEEAEAERMIARALAGAPGSEEGSEAPDTASAPRRPRGAGWALAAAAAVGLALGLGWWLGAAGGEVPLEARLPTGDAVVAAPGAVFELAALSERERRVELARGTVLFDVTPLEEGQRFEVVTPDAVVRVRGTVFSVERDARTRVRVYEGRVEVEARGSGRRVEVAAGRMWDARDAGAATALAEGPLAEAGEAAAARRAEAARLAETGRAEPRRAGIGRAADRRAQVVERRDREGEPERDEGREALAGPERAGHAEPLLPESDDARLARELPRAGRGATPDEPVRAEPLADLGAAALAPVEAPSAREASAGTGRRPPTRRAVRGWLVEGRYAEALEEARRRGWSELEADALQALGRFDEAADRWDGLARRGDAHAAYAAARLRFRHLDDPAGALASLDAAPDGSPLDERVLGLRARLLLRLHRADEAAAVARRYLSRHPNGGLAEWMRALLDRD